MKKKSRAHSINLSTKAEWIFRRFIKKMPYGWFSDFVSKVIISKYDSADLTKSFANEMVRLIECQKLDLTKEQLEWIKVAGSKDK